MDVCFGDPLSEAKISILRKMLEKSIFILQAFSLLNTSNIAIKSWYKLTFFNDSKGNILQQFNS